MGTRWKLTVDCARPVELAAFWCLALGYEPEPPPPGFASWHEWCARHGIPEDEWDTAASVVDPAGELPRIFFQGVPERKAAKNRLHLDVQVGGDRSLPAKKRWARITTEADRLVAAGATKVRQDDWQGEPHHWVMADPEGNEFCLC